MGFAGRFPVALTHSKVLGHCRALPTTNLRTLLIQGARAVLRFVKSRTDMHSVWLQQLIARRGYNCTAVALANHNARVIQALLSSDASYVGRGIASIAG
jgi:transposase